tara:strand:+ start:2250 stop:3089 length:840 start_codon:yes stop_codon:yes gene_type:complete
MGRYQVRAWKAKNFIGQTYTTKYGVIDTENGNMVVAEYSTKGRRQPEALASANNKARELNALASQGMEINPDKTFSATDGTTYATAEEAQARNDEIEAENLELERREGLEANVAKFEKRIKEAGRERAELAENVSARRQGQMLSNLQRAILGTGGDQAQIEAIAPQLQEQSGRTLQDLLAGSKARTQEQLAQFVPTEISAEYNQAQLADAMSQFLMQSEADKSRIQLDRARTQAELDSQPEWWEGLLGQGATLLGTLAVNALAGGGESGSGGMGSGGGY